MKKDPYADERAACVAATERRRQHPTLPWHYDERWLTASLEAIDPMRPGENPQTRLNRSLAGIKAMEAIESEIEAR